MLGSVQPAGQVGRSSVVPGDGSGREAAMKRRGWVAALTLVLAIGAPGAAEPWLHVRVVDGDGADAEQVSVNLPLSVVEALLPAIHSEGLDGGRVRWAGGEELDGAELRDVLAALADSPDGNFVTVRDGEQSVRVAKERGLLLVHADDDGERVRVRLPLVVVEAMLVGGGDEIDLVAGLRALAEHGGGDLVSVDGDGSRVRVWIDSSETGDEP